MNTQLLESSESIPFDGGSSESHKTLIGNYLYNNTDSFFHSMKRIRWDVFATFKFRSNGFKGKSDRARYKRKDFLWTTMKELKVKLSLSNNDLPYFGTEEFNDEDEHHIHLLIHCKNPGKASIEETRTQLLQLLDPGIIIMPSDDSQTHVQTVESSNDALDYICKLEKGYTEDKPYHLSYGFVNFYHKHLRWITKRQVSQADFRNIQI